MGTQTLRTDSERRFDVTVAACRQVFNEWPHKVFEYATGDGGVQWEWSVNQHEISVEINPAGELFCHDTHLLDLKSCFYVTDWTHMVIAHEWLQWQLDSAARSQAGG